MVEIISRLEEDALNVLYFMASNGLVANQGKTEFLLLNEKAGDMDRLKEIVVGETTIVRTSHTKLLGMQIEDSQEWNEHLKLLKSGLNHRLFLIRRIAQQVPRNKLMTLVHSLWVSKLRYGLQLCTRVRITTEDKKNDFMKSLQLTQNRLLRSLNKTRVVDKVSTESMLNKFNSLSVNQLAAEIKILEVWKSLNVVNCPTKLEPYNPLLNATFHSLRPKTNRVFCDSARLQISNSSFNIDAARLWNVVPLEVRISITVIEAKRAIKTFCKTLPV